MMWQLQALACYCLNITCSYIRLQQHSKMLIRIISKYLRPLPYISLARFDPPRYTFCEYPTDKFDQRQSHGSQRDHEGQKVREEKVRDYKGKGGAFGHKNKRNQGKQQKKPQTVQLATILQQYRVKSQDPDANQNAIFAQCCKKVSSQYRKQHHLQYVGMRQQLQKLLIIVPTLNYNNMQLLQLLHILDMLRTLSRIEAINRHSYDKAKKTVFAVADKYMKLVESPPLNQILVLYCKLTPLNYPNILPMSNKVYQLLSQAKKQKGILPFTPFQHFVVIKSHSKRLYLSITDQQILQLIMEDLQAREQEIDKVMYNQLTKTLVDMDIPNYLANQESLDFFDRLLKNVQQRVQGGLPIQMLKHLVDCPRREHPTYKKIVYMIYRRAIQKMGFQNLTVYPFSLLIDSIKHLNPSDFTTEDQEIVLKRMKQLHGSGSKFLRQQILPDLVELIRFNFFNQKIQEVNEFVNQPDFQIYWTLPCAYSLKGLKYPLKKIRQKLERGIKFSPQLNSLKIAIVLAVQHKLQPEDDWLAATYHNFVTQIAKLNWEELGVEWLSKLSAYNPVEVQTFHQLYSHLYMPQVQLNQLQIKKQTQLQKKDRSSHLSYWQYIFAVSQLDKAFPSRVVYGLAAHIITLCAMKETNKINLPLTSKPILLASLLARAVQRKISYNDSQSSNFPSLLCIFYPLLFEGKESFIQIYLESVLQLVKDYDQIKRAIQPQIHLIIMKIINIKQNNIRTSIKIRQIITELLKNAKFSKPYDEQFLYHVKNSLLREALNKNMLQGSAFPKQHKEFFSKKEHNLIDVLKEKYESKTIDKENLLFVLKSANQSQTFLKDNQTEILQIINQASLQELEELLVHFCHQQGETRNKIFGKLVSQFTRKLSVKEVDILLVLQTFTSSSLLAANNLQAVKKLIQTVLSQLENDMSLLLLSSHAVLLNLAEKYKVDRDSYVYRLQEYVWENQYRGNASLDILLQISKSSTTKELNFQILQNYYLLNPESSIRLIALQEESVTDIPKKLAQITQYPLKAVNDSIFTHYLESKYSFSFPKKTQKDEGLLLAATQLGGDLISVLKHNGIDVKIDELGIDQVYLIKDNIVLGFFQQALVNEKKFIQKALHQLYPNKEVYLTPRKASSIQIEQLLTQITPFLQLNQNQISKITSELGSSQL